MKASKESIRVETEKKALRSPPRSVMLAQLREEEAQAEIEAEESREVERRLAAMRWLRG